MAWLGHVKTVLWSFIGIGGRKKGDGTAPNLLAVVAVAFTLVALLLGTLAWVARSAAG
jgi:hypothetical protein